MHSVKQRVAVQTRVHFRLSNFISFFSNVTTAAASWSYAWENGEAVNSRKRKEWLDEQSRHYQKELCLWVISRVLFVQKKKVRIQIKCVLNKYKKNPEFETCGALRQPRPPLNEVVSTQKINFAMYSVAWSSQHCLKVYIWRANQGKYFESLSSELTE